MRKLLSTLLNERTESIEYRAIRANLMKVAQSGKNEYRTIKICQYALDRLQNEGISIEQVNEFGYDKYLLKW